MLVDRLFRNVQSILLSVKQVVDLMSYEQIKITDEIKKVITVTLDFNLFSEISSELTVSTNDFNPEITQLIIGY
jgi:hypothetical protein